MSALIENAITWAEIADNTLDTFKKNPTETRYLRAACNHYQQAAEFIIKGTIAALGYEYKRGHDLEENAEMLIGLINTYTGEIWDALKSVLDDLQWFSDKSGLIIKWEQKPRYDGENFYAKESTVNQCKEHLSNILVSVVKNIGT